MKSLSIVLFLALLSSSLFAFSDADNDGMMDSWETKYGVSDPQADVDGDGLTNLQEFIRQSDPSVKNDTKGNFTQVKTVDTNGTATAIAKYGEYILVVDGSEGLKVYDNKYNLVSVLKTNLTSATDIQVKGKYAFVQNSSSSISVLDLSDVNNPKIVKTFASDNSNNSYLSKIYINGDALYTLGYVQLYVNNTWEYKQQLKIYDISTPTNPVLKSTTDLRDEDGYQFAITVVNNIAYIAGKYSVNNNYKSYLRIFDISDIATPKLQGSLDFTEGYSPYGGIAKVGKYLYIGTGDSTVLADISDSTKPQYIKILSSLYGISDIKVDTNKAYMINNSGTFYLFDVSNPPSPQQLKSISLGSGNGNTRMLLKDNLLILPRGYYGFEVYDSSYFKTPSVGSGTLAFNNFADLNSSSKVVLFNYNGDTTKTNKYLDIYQFFDSNKTVTLKKYYLDGTLIKEKSGKYTLLYGGKAAGMSFDDDYFVLYSADGKIAKAKEGVSAFVDGKLSGDTDTTIVSQNALKPYMLSSLKMSATDIQVKGKYAFVQNGSSSINVVDLSDVNNPKIVKTFASDSSNNSYSNLYKIYIKGNTLYTLESTYFYTDSTYKQQLKIYDISTPTNPVLKSTTDLRNEDGSQFAITVVNNIAYIAGYYRVNNNSKSYLKIFDVSDIAKPKLQGSLDFTEGSSPNGGIAKVGEYLYIGTLLANVSDITKPQYIKKSSIMSYTKTMKLDNNRAYMLSAYNGVNSYNISNPLSPQQIKHISFSESNYDAKNMLLKDNLLFVPRGYYGFDVYDATSFEKITTIDTDGTSYSIESLGSDKIVVADGSSLKIYDLKAYDKDFDGIPDKFDLYPNDTSEFFLDTNNNGKINAVNANTNPSDKLYNGYNFDDTTFHLITSGEFSDDVQLLIASVDLNYTLTDFNTTALFNTSNSYTSYVLSFDNFDSKFVTELYNLSLSDSNSLINSTSKENNAQLLSLGSAYSDKLLTDNSGIDKRYIGFTPTETGNYSFVIMKQGGLSSLIKTDSTKEAKITAKIYESNATAAFDGVKTLLGQQEIDPTKSSSIKMPLEKYKKYYISFDLQNIKQFKYNIVVVKEYENYAQSIKLDANGEATYSFVVPKSTTYQYALNANRAFKSKLYLGSSIDDAHKLFSFDGKFTNETIGLRASIYTIKLQGDANESIFFVLGQSDKRKEIEPNNTYQSATVVEGNNFQATLKANEFDYYKIKTGDSWNSSSTFSVTITPNLQFSNEEIANYNFNLFVYNASGDVIEKSFEYLENGSITYNFNVGNSGTYFLRFNSNYDKDFDYRLSTSGTSTPQLTQTELAYAQKYNTYILGRGLNLEASTQEVQDNGELIILAGDADDPTDPLYIGTQKLTKNMYNRFLLRGLSHEDIYYLNATTDTIDLDNDGIPDDVVDDKHPTKESFYKTIKERASSDKKGPLFIYMVDHGANASFKLSSGDIVTASDLKKAIDAFTTASSRQVVVIIEACKSGSFIPTLTENDTRDDILVITSSQKGKLSYIDRFGNVSFTKFLADSILSGNSLKDAYASAKTKLAAQGGVYTLQVPQISTAATDNLLNFRVGGNFAAASMSLGSINDYFGKGKTSFDISTLHKNIDLYASIDGSGGVNRVWATVIPPNYQPPVIADDSFQTPNMIPYTVELTYDTDSKNYIGTYDKLEAAYEGEYAITYYIEDSDGNVISKAIKINGKNIDSAIAQQTNSPVFELSSTYIEVLLSGSDEVTISGLGAYNYTLSNTNSAVASASLSGKKITITGKDVGETTLSVTATNNGYTTKKELLIKVKESASVKKATIDYIKGWSLISSKTVDSIVPSKIQNISTSWKFVKGKWQVYAKESAMQQAVTSAGLENMNEIKKGEGGWIFTTASGTLTQIGTPYNILGDDLSSKLHYGWNLIGTGEDLSIKNLYVKMASYGSNIANIWAYRAGKWSVYTKNLFYIEKLKEDMNISTLDALKAGEGFWIYIE